jgi:hypothetical protein
MGTSILRATSRAVSPLAASFCDKPSHMLHWTRDFQFAIRGFRKSPVFSAVAVLSLALGIGANTAVFTLVDQLILRRLPVQDPDRLVWLVGEGRHYGSDMGSNPLSYPMFQDLSDGNQVFSGLMCRYRVNPSVMVGSETEVVGGELVSGNYFRVLGIQPASGRLFNADDDVPLGAHPYAVLSYTWWQSRFAGDPAAVGRTIRVNGTPVTIVGVAQAGFDGVEPGLAASIFCRHQCGAGGAPGIRRHVESPPPLGQRIWAPQTGHHRHAGTGRIAVVVPRARPHAIYGPLRQGTVGRRLTAARCILDWDPGVQNRESRANLQARIAR